MIKLTYSEICNEGFMHATKLLWQSDQLSGDVAAQVHRICKKGQQVLLEVRKAEQDIAKKHAKLDDKGEFIRANMTPYSFDSVEQAKAFEKELDEYLEANFVELKTNKIDFRKIAHVQGIPPACFDSLDCIFSNLPPEA